VHRIGRYRYGSGSGTAQKVRRAPMVTPNPDTICIGQTSTLTASGASSYLWSPPDFLSSTTTATVTVTPNAVGTYTYTVVGDDPTVDCNGMAMVEVVVVEEPDVSAGAPQTTCVNTDLQLIGSPIALGSAQAMWSGLHVNATGLFNAPDTGRFTLTYAYSAFGCSDISEVEVCVTEPPVANFSIDQDFACGSLSVQPTNLTNVIASCDMPTFVWTANFMGAACTNGQGAWSFSSGNANALQPTFLFTQEGVYEIQLTVSNSCSTDVFTQMVRVGGMPQVSLNAIDDACDAVTLTPSFSADSCNAENTTYLFTAVGGVPSSFMGFPAPEINFPNPGDYTIVLTVTTNCGTAVDSVSFSVLAGPNIDVEANPTTLCRGDTLEVTNNSSGDNLAFTWSSTGPGTVIIQAPTATEPLIIFPDIGDYELNLSIQNEVCEALTWNETIEVLDLPEVQIVPTEDFCGTAAFQPVINVNIPEQEIDSISWSFPGGVPASSMALNPGTITYDSDGNYSFSVELYTQCGMAMDEWNFNILEAPEIAVSLSSDMACVGDTIEVINQSTGDSLSYSLQVSDPSSVLILNPNDREPQMVFLDTGTFVLTMEIDNPVCEELFWSDTIQVNRIPSITLANIPNFCGSAIIDPSASLNLNPEQIDSIYWSFEGGVPNFSNDLIPGTISYNEPGTYTVTMQVFNACGFDVQDQTFSILQPIEVSTNLSDDFTCTLPFEVMVDNQTTGDSLFFNWVVDGPHPSAVSFSPSNLVEEPMISFQDTGVYVITQIISNPACDSIIWRDTVSVFSSPMLSLTPVDSFCQSIALTPMIDYGVSRIDSVIWSFPLATPDQSTDLFPSDIQYLGAGDYVYSLTAFNICGMATVIDTFTIDTLPPIVLGPADTICIDQGLFQVPDPSPLGGIWLDSLGQEGVITTNGIFNPLEAGGGSRTIEYFFKVGACEISTYKTVFVVDLDSVDAGADQLACISDTLIFFDEGFPAGGWYIGLGIQDSLLGTFNPSSLAIGEYTIHYFYQLPETECIGTDSFTVTIHPLPIPQISISDSICVDVPIQIFSTGTGESSYEWTVDEMLYTVANPFHTFTDTGYHEIHLSVASAVGCRDSISRMVYVAGPPIASFAKDTTMGCAILAVNFFNESLAFETGSEYFWDFGNGMTSTEANPGTIFYDQGLADTTYYIQLTASNYCGSTQYLDSILVFPRPIPRIRVNVDEGCEPLTVAFNNVSQGLPTSFFWDMGNGNTYTDSIPPDQIYYADDSLNVIYTVTLIAFNECGPDTARQEILVKPNTVRAFFSVEDNVGCEPFTIFFQNSTSPDTALNYNWDFGDGATSIDKNPSHTFFPQGDTSTIYEVLLIADNGCSFDSMQLPVTVHPAPEISFTYTPLEPCLGDTIYFNNTSIGVLDPIWDFGDGTTIEMNNPFYVFASPGDFTVRLTAFAQNTNCPGVAEAVLSVGTIPTAAFSIDQTEGCPGLEVTFVDQSLGGLFYSWDFGNGITAAGAGPHTIPYDTTGFYDVNLSAISANGCENDSLFSAIQIYPEPSAMFTAFQVDDCGLPAEVCIQDQSIDAIDYDWTFDLGAGILSSAIEPNPCIDVDVAGPIGIVLSVTNAFQCSDEASLELTVYDEPQAIAYPGDTTVCTGISIPFTSASLNTSIIEWTFTDGFVANDSSFSRTFETAGNVGYTVVVANGSGCTDTLRRNILIRPSPVAAFQFETLPEELTNTYQFYDRSSQTEWHQSWIDRKIDTYWSTPRAVFQTGKPLRERDESKYF
ncbi:MAG: PKD domain-containing protein, partial [Bacteroidota bacterium]